MIQPDACSNIKSEIMSSNIRLPKICQHCGNEFIAKTTKTQYCSDNCAKRAYKARKKKAKLQNVKSIEKQRIEYFSQSIKDKEFLSIKETCTLLGASRMTIYRQIKSGNINAIKLGRRTIIKRADINKLFQL